MWKVDVCILSFRGNNPRRFTQISQKNLGQINIEMQFSSIYSQDFGVANAYKNWAILFIIAFSVLLTYWKFETTSYTAMAQLTDIN